MSMTRREALAAAAVAGVGAMANFNPAQAAPAAETSSSVSKAPAKLRLSSQESVIPGKSLAEKLDKMEKWGFEGLEVNGHDLKNRVKELQTALKGRKIQMSAICAGFEGCLLSTDEAVRKQCFDTTKEILTAAGELGSVGMIIVPSFTDQDNKGTMPHKQAREALTGFARWDAKDRKRQGTMLQELGDFAAKAGTRLLLEPLNRGECYFLRTLADGASMCRDLENPGVALMGDFWHMTWEENSDMGAFLTGGKYLKHVHMASRGSRNMPGDDGEADNYVDGFKGLKMLGYQGFVSLECGCKGDRDKRIPEAVALLRKQWAEA
ncbi:MAG: sugar phosphate isomerase/epimerase [Phycisphaerae bacterium]|nr:sugar phosphate isomerase/epimerase [Phycisphaerae bacterium]